MLKRFLVLLLIAVFLGAGAARADSLFTGPNVNMVNSNKKQATDMRWPQDNIFLQASNEPSMDVSTRRTLTLFGGANDYRSVDFAGLQNIDENGDVWVADFKSFDGGITWTSNLHPGCSFKVNGVLIPECNDGGVLQGQFSASSDPVVRAGHNGLFYYSFIAFNRGNNATGAIAVSRYIDSNNKPAPDPSAQGADQRISFLSTAIVDTGTAGVFLDKPSFFVDVPRPNAPTCTVGGTGGVPSQTFPGGAVYLAYAKFTGQDPSNNNPKSQVLVAKSTDCGKSWKITQVAQSFTLNNGTSLVVDPNNGSNVYVAWRLLASGKQNDAIMIAKSTNGGASFGTPVQVASYALPALGTPPVFFDQPKVPIGTQITVNGENVVGPSFRAEATPALTIDGNSRLYLAWSQRGMVSGTNDARIVLTTSTDGISWTAPSQVAPIPSTSWNSGGRGHQLMPAMTVVGDRLAVTFLDQGEDHTKGTFANSTSPEVRKPIGSLDPGCSPTCYDPGKVYTDYITDGTPGMKIRHTLDVRVAYATVSNGAPVFQPSTKVSRYRAGSRPGSNSVEQIEFNPPNFPMFVHGTAPFIGDYIEIKGLSAIPTAGGGWRPNLRLPSDPPGMIFNSVFNVAWADDRNVRPPHDGNWANYTPPVIGPAGSGTSYTGTVATTSANLSSPGNSLFCSAGSDCPTGTQRPACQPRQAMARNQNVYTARLDNGVYMAAFANFKQSAADAGGKPIQRAFAVFVQNTTPDCRAFQLSLPAAPPPGVSALSFLQSSALSQLTINIPGKSTISRTVYLTSATNPPPAVTVSAVEVASQCGTPVAGLQAYVMLNPDPSNPAVIDAITGGTLGPEAYTPDILSSNSVFNTNNNPNITNPVITDGDIIDGDIIDGDIIDGDIIDGDIIDGDIIDGDIIDGDIIDGDIISGTMVDTNLTTANVGNTPGSFLLKLYQKGTINVCPAACGLPGQPSCPSGCLKFQLIVRKSRRKLQAGTCAPGTLCANACQLQATGSSTSVTNIPRPQFSTAGKLNTTDGDIIDGDIINATSVVGPLDSSTQVTVRSVDPTGTTSPAKIASLIREATGTSGPPVSGVVGAQAANTGSTMPSLTLVITTIALPDGISGTAYSQQVAVLGGVGAVTLSVIAGGTNPCGLTLNPITGVLSGTPPAPTTCPFTVQAQDSATPPNVYTQDLSIRIGAPLVITTSSLPASAPNAVYSATLAASGGFTAYNWSVISGSLPGGLTLSPGGSITGVASAAGVFNFTVQVTDSSCLVSVTSCQRQTATKALTIAVDNTPPVITPTITPSPNAAGWNNTTPVSVTWSVTDPESGIASSQGCTPSSLTTETAGTNLTCSATNGAGLSNSVTVTIKIDKTNPVISGSRTPAANAAGWNNTNVTVSFTCADAGPVQSGIGTNTLAGATLTTEGTNQSVTNTGSCVDRAGNAAVAATVGGINIDKTPPTISLTTPPPPPANTNYLLNGGATAAYTCADALSGLAAPCAAAATNITAGTPAAAVPNGGGLTATVGAYSFLVTATDVAGNTSAITANYAVTYAFTGFLSPLQTAGPASSPTNSGSSNQGQALPVKWQLADANGTLITTLASLTSLVAVPSSLCGTPGPSVVNICSTVGGVSSCTGSTTYRVDSTGTFIINADTSAMAKACYEIVATYNDSKAYGTLISLK